VEAKVRVAGGCSVGFWGLWCHGATEVVVVEEIGYMAGVVEDGEEFGYTTGVVDYGEKLGYTTGVVEVGGLWVNAAFA
jgi:hypothetical protein